MSKATIPRVMNIYKTLMNFHGHKLNFNESNEESCNMQAALYMIAECGKLIKNREQRELIKLKNMCKDLKDFLNFISKYNSFVCNCNDTMRFIHLLAKSRDGLANRLPELEKDVELVILQVQKTVDAIIETHQQPNSINLNIDKKVQMIKLIDMFNVNKVKYENFEKRFDRLFNYLKSKLKLKINQNRSKHVNQAAKYLEGKSDIFLSVLEEEDDDFIKKFFGGSNEDTQKVLRNSLKEVMAKRGVSLVKADETKVELTDEQKNLLDRLGLFYTDLVNMRSGIKFFQNLVLSTNLQDIQTFDVILLDLKKEIEKILAKTNL